MKYIIFILALTLFSCDTSSKKKNMDSEYLISTSSESEERAKNALSLEGKEDVSKILSLNIPEPLVSEERGEKEYFANEKYDWIVTLEPEKEAYFKKDSLTKYLSNKWREGIQYPTIYCIPKDDTKWTYFSAGDNESIEFRKIAFGWKLYDPIEEPPLILTAKILTKFNKSIKKVSKRLKAKTPTYNFSIEEAESISKDLSSFVSQNNMYSIIVLKTDNKFEGKEIWDVMMSLGLRWGDMDLFHWNNDKYDFGDDQLLSVWTSTSPGYFFPEEIAAGRVQTNDLIFGFSIPRSIAPQEVLDVMLKATEYAQTRLGGELLDENGNEFDINKEKEKVRLILNNLKTKSIKSGIDDALYLFQ